MRDGFLGRLTRPEIRQERNRLYQACLDTGRRVQALYKITFTGHGRDHEYDDARAAWNDAKATYQRFLDEYGR